MREFATLLDRLSYTPARNGKLRLLSDYFRRAPDPARGYALAAITGTLSIEAVKAASVRALAEARVDPQLFGWSYDYVGDLAETVALIWPAQPGANRPPDLAEVVETLRAASRREAPQLVAGWLDALDPTGRWALLKLMTGALRIGVSARLAKTALAEFGGVTLDEVEEVWHGLTPPYETLFAWLEKRAPRPEVGDLALFRPLMLANPLEEGELESLDPADYLAEWKWDGIRVQAVSRPSGERRLFSRTGDDIGRAFPDLLEQFAFDAVIDGELLVGAADAVAPFNDLQQRLNRKTVTAKMTQDYPAFLRAYDILFEGGEDLRVLPFAERRQRLESLARPGGARPRRPLAAGALRPLGGIGGVARQRPRRRHRRADAEAEGQHLCRRPAARPLVQMETRRTHGRSGTDVCPARPWQTFVLLFGLHLRRLGVGARGRVATDAGRQGLFRFHRSGIASPRQMGSRQYGGPLRAGARGAAGPRAGGGVRQHPRLDAAQIGLGDALPANPPHPLGQARRRSRSTRSTGGDGGIIKIPQCFMYRWHCCGGRASVFWHRI